MISTAPVPVVVSTATGESSCWRQHCTKDGKVFWNNTLTGKSTWEKPDELKSDVELAMASMPWKEYTTSDGRTYWSNKYSKKSVWKCPPEVEQLKKELNCTWEPFKDKQTAISRLRTLFRIKSITTKTRLDDALTAIKADPRSEFFSILTSGEKRQAYAEYQTQLKKLERERERLQKPEARKMYLDHLAKWEDLKLTSHEAQFSKIYPNEWWMTFLPLSEREELFDDHMEENEARFLDEYRKERNEKRSKVIEYFRQGGILNLNSKWDDALDLIIDENVFHDVEPCDILIAWEEFINGLHEKEKLKQDEHIHLLRAERRFAFIQLVKKAIEQGAVHAKASFADFVLDYQDAPEYINVVGVPLATPREIFEDVLLPIKNDYEDKKTLLKQVLKTTNIRVTSSTTFEEFRHSICEANADCRSIDDVSTDIPENAPQCFRQTACFSSKASFGEPLVKSVTIKMLMPQRQICKLEINVSIIVDSELPRNEILLCR